MQCEKCGRDSPGGVGEACLWCGHLRGSAPGGAPQGTASPWQTPRAPGAQPAPHLPSGNGIPWENEQNAQSLIETVRRVFLEPSATFANASPGVGLGPGLIYALVLGVAGGIVAQLWQWVFGDTVTNLMKPLLESSPQMRDALANASTGALATLIMLPILVLLGVFLWAGVTHVCLLILGSANGRFEDTIRAIAFVYGTMGLFNLIPQVGGLIGVVWATVVSIFAIREMHHTTGWKAALAILLPDVVFGVCCCCAAVGIFAAVGKNFLGGS